MIGIVSLMTAGSLATGAVVAGTTLMDVPERPRDRDVPCGAVWERLPDDLRDDLSALQDMSPTERRAALKEIRRDAREGEYGDRVQRFAERMADRRAELGPAEQRAARALVAERLRERREACS